MKPTERELKTLINQESAKKLLNSYDFLQPIIQKNTYYDTPDQYLKSLNGAIRIRAIENTYIFTLKIRKDDITHYEFEKEINTDKLHSIQDEEIAEWVNQFHIDLNQCKETVSFTTKRYVCNLEKATLCLDFTTFNNKEDIEFEYEYKEEHDGIDAFNEILSEIHMKYTKNAPSKIARAFE